MAQLSNPDMRLPIQYALTWPDRYFYRQDEPLDLTKVGTLHFSAPDMERYPLLALAYEAGKKGGNLGVVMNAANEMANQAFRSKEIPFLMIEDIVIDAVHTVPYKELETVQDLIDADAWGRQFALDKIRSYKE